MKRCPTLHNLMVVAHELHMPLGRLLMEMDPEEIGLWLGYFRLQNEEISKPHGPKRAKGAPPISR